MSKIQIGEKDLSDSETGISATVWLGDADERAVAVVLAADEAHDDGRSQWLWVRFPNGDLMLGTFPQGDTYFETEVGREV